MLSECSKRKYWIKNLLIMLNKWSKGKNILQVKLMVELKHFYKRLMPYYCKLSLHILHSLR